MAAILEITCLNKDYMIYPIAIHLQWRFRTGFSPVSPHPFFTKRERTEFYLYFAVYHFKLLKRIVTFFQALFNRIMYYSVFFIAYIPLKYTLGLKVQKKDT